MIFNIVFTRNQTRTIDYVYNTIKKTIVTTLKLLHNIEFVASDYVRGNEAIAVSAELQDLRACFNLFIVENIVIGKSGTNCEL